MVVMSTSTFIVSRPGSSGYPPTLPAEARSQSDQVLDREQNGDVADHPEDHLREIAGDLQIVSARLQLANAAAQRDDCAHRQQKEDRDDDQESFKHFIRAHLRLDPRTWKWSAGTSADYLFGRRHQRKTLLRRRDPDSCSIRIKD